MTSSTYKVHQARSVWCGHGKHDKIYNIQVVEKDGLFEVWSQWGKRLGNSLGEKCYYSGNHKYSAEREFNKLLNKKVHKPKKEECYDEEVPARIPLKFGGQVMTEPEKEALKKTARGIQALFDFLSGDIDTELIIKPPEIGRGGFDNSVFDD